MNTPFSPSASKAWKQLMAVWKKMETRVSLVFYATGLLLVCLYEVGMNKDAAAADQMSPNALLEFALAVLLSYRSVQHMLFMAPTSSLVVVHFWYPTMKPEIRPYLSCLGLMLQTAGLASLTAAPELSVHVAAFAAAAATFSNQFPVFAGHLFSLALFIHVICGFIMMLQMYHICGQSTNRRASNQDSELLFEMMEDPLDADPNINIAISFRGMPANKINTLVKEIEKVFENQEKAPQLPWKGRTERGALLQKSWQPSGLFSSRVSPNANMEAIQAVLFTYSAVQFMLMFAPGTSLMLIHYLYDSWKPEVRPYLSCIGLVVQTVSLHGIPANKIETLVKEIEKVFENQEKGIPIRTLARRTYRGRGELREVHFYGETESAREEEAVDRLRKPVIKKTRIQRELGLMKMDISHRRVI